MKSSELSEINEDLISNLTPLDVLDDLYNRLDHGFTKQYVVECAVMKQATALTNAFLDAYAYSVTKDEAGMEDIANA